MRAIIVSVMLAVLVPLGGCFHHTQAVAVTPLTTPSLKWSRISHGSHSATAFSHCSHLRAGFRWQRVASANTIGFCQKASWFRMVAEITTMAQIAGCVRPCPR